MIKFENTDVMGLEAAIRGMRNPLNSWEKSDSLYCNRDLLRDCTTCVHRFTDYSACTAGGFEVGSNDLSLMKRLANAGTDHRKFMRMIAVYVDITAPLYWWKEFDTYKVGTVANSCSTMHKVAEKEFTIEDFSCEHLENSWLVHLKETIKLLNEARDVYHWCNTDAKKEWWWQMIQLLPSSYNQKRTVMLNYEVLANIYKSRNNHKLDEWSVGFMDWIKSLPYSELITGKEK